MTLLLETMLAPKVVGIEKQFDKESKLKYKDVGNSGVVLCAE